MPVVASAERAFQLLRQEKAFDSTPPRGGTALLVPASSLSHFYAVNMSQPFSLGNRSPLETTVRAPSYASRTMPRSGR